MDLKNGMPAEIHVKTDIHQPGNEPETHSFDTKGQLVQIGATLYLRYQEEDETGQSATVTFKFDPEGTVQLTRAGEMRMRLKFDEKEKASTIYRTNYGVMPIDTWTKHLHVSLKDQPFSGKVHIEYQLSVGEEILGEYNLELLFTT